MRRGKGVAETDPAKEPGAALARLMVGTDVLEVARPPGNLGPVRLSLGSLDLLRRLAARTRRPAAAFLFGAAAAGAVGWVGFRLAAPGMYGTILANVARLAPTAAALAAASPLEFYRRINVGVAGTAMPAFADRLSLEDRWALALFASGLRYTDAQRSRGEAVLRARCPACRALVGGFAETAPVDDDSLAALLADQLGLAPGDSLLRDVVAFARTASARDVLGNDRALLAGRTLRETRDGVAAAVRLVARPEGEFGARGPPLPAAAVPGPAAGPPGTGSLPSPAPSSAPAPTNAAGSDRAAPGARAAHGAPPARPPAAPPAGSPEAAGAAPATPRTPHERQSLSHGRVAPRPPLAAPRNEACTASGRLRASANWAALANRSAGSFSRARCTASAMCGASRGRRLAMSRGSSVTTAAMIACAVDPVCGGSPLSIS